MTRLLFLTHPPTDIFSAYGVQAGPFTLRGILIIDRPPSPRLGAWLAELESVFGEYTLLIMTAAGARGLSCFMLISPADWQYVRQLAVPRKREIVRVIKQTETNVSLALKWEPFLGLWVSEIVDYRGTHADDQSDN